MKRKRKLMKLSYTCNNTQYYESNDGEVIAYTGGPIHKVNFFSVDKKNSLIRSLVFDRSVVGIYETKKGFFILERKINDE